MPPIPIEFNSINTSTGKSNKEHRDFLSGIEDYCANVPTKNKTEKTIGNKEGGGNMPN